MKRRRSERGATLVESALTLLLLLTVLFGIIEFGHLFNVYQVMTNAAREGARFAVAPCPFAAAVAGVCTAGQLPNSTAVQNQVQNYLNAAGIFGTTPTVTTYDQATCGATANPPACPGWPGLVNTIPLSYTRVSVSLPFTFYFFRYTPTLTTYAVMRNETN